MYIYKSPYQFSFLVEKRTCEVILKVYQSYYNRLAEKSLNCRKVEVIITALSVPSYCHGALNSKFESSNIISYTWLLLPFEFIARFR